MYSFEKLVVWQKTIDFIEHIYILCNKIPKVEEKNLIDQIRRSSTSIALNIAEGNGAESNVEHKHFLYMARKSLYETRALLLIIKKIYRISIDTYTIELDQIGKMLNGLINSQK